MKKREKTPDKILSSTVTEIGPRPVRIRPAILRALGRSDPPAAIAIAGLEFTWSQTFKHDSWAATALYARDDQRVVCKFNRIQPCAGISMRWLGRWLAHRESAFFRILESVPGIPRAFHEVSVSGQVQSNAFAHEFVPGRPLSLVHDTDAKFFERLLQLLDAIHSQRMAYVDLNKPENVLVGDDGHPYMFDFQISVRLPDWPFARGLLRLLQQSDRYHLMKHRTWRLHRDAFDTEMERHRPWWIRWHRAIGIPFRTLRRRVLVGLGIRTGRGRAETEVAPEVGLCTPEKLSQDKRQAA